MEVRHHWSSASTLEHDTVTEEKHHFTLTLFFSVTFVTLSVQQRGFLWSSAVLVFIKILYIYKLKKKLVFECGGSSLIKLLNRQSSRTRTS